MNQVVEFHARIEDALNNTQARANFRHAMDGFIARRAAQFPDPDALKALRTHARAIKNRCLAELPELLERLEARLIENGIQVHWAEDAEQACAEVDAILAAKGAKRLVKGKSMVTEEIELNRYLERRGYDVLESDLGEFIIQLCGETPSHIVVPAVHKNRQEIARLFHERFPEIPYTEDVDQLTQSARRILRDKFMQAEAGISGVNFAVAESGTLCLVENEGNGRMCTTVPPLHIAVTGIEKVVATLADVPPLLSLLTRSATGQPITTYFNMISGPRRAGELDGPEEVHLVLVDNGRSRIYGDPELQATLRCIRCGACINHCPVYVRLGGHAYATTYPGPIGTILEPQRQGMHRAGALVAASTLCGACSEVCPVRIPIPALINRLRAEGNSPTAGGAVLGAGALRKGKEAFAWRLWRALYGGRLYGTFARLVGPFRALVPRRLGPWARGRVNPQPSLRSLHQRAREEGFRDE